MKGLGTYSQNFVRYPYDRFHGTDALGTKGKVINDLFNRIIRHRYHRYDRKKIIRSFVNTAIVVIVKKLCKIFLQSFSWYGCFGY